MSNYQFIGIKGMDGSYQGVVHITHIVSIDKGVQPFDYSVTLGDGTLIIPIDEKEYLRILSVMDCLSMIAPKDVDYKIPDVY